MSGLLTQRSIKRATPVAAPLRRQVIELLRDAIVTFEYQPGQRLVERELCDRFDVSRTVIREALRHLEAEGLIQLVANRGPVVSILTVSEARDLYEVRETLEALAARLSATKADAAMKRRLHRALSRIDVAYKKRDLAEQLHAKDEFYVTLTESSGNTALASLLRTVQARVQLLRGLSLQAPGRAEASIAELRMVVAAIEAHDPEEAARLAVLHVRNAAEAAFDRLEWLEQHPSTTTDD